MKEQLIGKQFSRARLVKVGLIKAGFQPWEGQNERFVLKLIRHTNVRWMKNARSSGLEMLKGRESTR